MKEISLNDACERVGAAIFAKNGSAALTKREHWLIERYVDGSQENPPPPLGQVE